MGTEEQTIILRNTRILVQCNQIGQREFILGYQDMLKQKKIKHIFVSGNTVGKNNEPLTSLQFFLSLFDNNTLIFDMPSTTQLAFNTLKLIDLRNYNIDFQQSKIVFPTNIVAVTNVELIVFYEDNNPPQ